MAFYLQLGCKHHSDASMPERHLNDDNFDLGDKKRENRLRKEDCQLQALLDEDDTQSQKNACRVIGCFSSSHFHAATCHGEDLKDRKIGAA